MKNPFHRILANSSVAGVMLQAAEANILDIEQAGTALSDEEVVLVATWTTSQLRTSGVQETLGFGCLLLLFRAATLREDRRGLFDSLLEDLGLSRTQAYRCMAAWKCFGSKLVLEPKLVQKFVAESLKVLAADQTPQVARDEALALARAGETISVRKAYELQSQHAPPIAERSSPNNNLPEPQVSQSTSPTKGGIWSFVGEYVRLIVKPATRSSQTDVGAIIRDLEAAIEDLRQQYRDSTGHVLEPANGASHV